MDINFFAYVRLPMKINPITTRNNTGFLVFIFFLPFGKDAVTSDFKRLRNPVFAYQIKWFATR
jgi:hypothetical protein